MVQPRVPSERAPFTTPRTTPGRLCANSTRVHDAHEDAHFRPLTQSGEERSSAVLWRWPPQDGRTGPRDRHHRDERCRLALEPVELRPAGDDARQHDCGKKRVSSHWAAVPEHWVSMPKLLLLSCAARRHHQKKAGAHRDVCACLRARVALGEQAPADQEPREPRRASVAFYI